jgi:hypothetical protein
MMDILKCACRANWIFFIFLLFIKTGTKFTMFIPLNIVPILINNKKIIQFGSTFGNFDATKIDVTCSPLNLANSNNYELSLNLTNYNNYIINKMYFYSFKITLPFYPTECMRYFLQYTPKPSVGDENSDHKAWVRSTLMRPSLNTSGVTMN